uniref:Chromosome 1 open reading frame 146 n=1 Tax=Echeneis naucrates TaxID=173247 RepID=A0A665WAE5_ECHNA
MATDQEPTSPWKTTIIVSSSAQVCENPETVRLKKSAAFLLIDLQDFPECFEESGLIERVKKFVQVHRNSFLLLYSPFVGKKELAILSWIQCRFFGRNLKILPVQNSADVVKGMLTIAKATSKPHVVTIRTRLSLAQAHIIERSPVWEMLRDMLSESVN